MNIPTRIAIKLALRVWSSNFLRWQVGTLLAELMYTSKYKQVKIIGVSSSKSPIKLTTGNKMHKSIAAATDVMTLQSKFVAALHYDNQWPVNRFYLFIIIKRFWHKTKEYLKINRITGKKLILTHIVTMKKHFICFSTFLR